MNTNSETSISDSVTGDQFIETMVKSGELLAWWPLDVEVLVRHKDADNTPLSEILRKLRA